jgi:DNA ligase-1
MNDLADGETTTMQGSGSSVYTLKNSGGVYSCTCPAWMHQSIGIERRTCKHLRKLRGDDAEKERLGSAELTGKPARAARPASTGAAEDAEEDAAPPVLLAHKWETETDITGWWLSEKLDGVRAYWDGKQFLSRLGNRFYPPPWFVEKFPDHPLDGELWGGRKLFQRTVGIVKRQDQSPLWKDLLFVVFDAPAHPGTFEERIEHARTVIEERAIPYARIHEHHPCKDLVHLREELARVEAMGGEGLMARKPRSKYEVGRSSTLLKVKTFHDAEARVIAHAPGAGRHKGRLGALVVELADGTKFNVGTGFSDAERESPPPIGSIVTFRYQELSDAGVPRFPSYVGVRIDAKVPSSLVTRQAPGAPVPSRDEAPKPKKAAAPVVAKAASGGKKGSSGARYFEFSEGTSSKFWEISIDGASFTTRYGKIGTDGQQSLKEYASEALAQKEHDKLVAEKTKKGYVEK